MSHTEYIKECRCQSTRNKHLRWISRIALIGSIIILLGLMVNLYTHSDGAYSKETNLIFLFPKEHTTHEVTTVAMHEIGHYVFFKRLTANERQEFIKISNESNYFVTPYAQTNAIEDFAEMFSYSMFCEFRPEFLSAQDQNKINFLIDYKEEMFR